METQSQTELGNKTTRISTFRGGSSSSDSTCTCCPLLHAAWCILHASQNMPQLVKQESKRGRGSGGSSTQSRKYSGNESRLVSFRSSRCAPQVPTSSALIVTLFAHLKDTDTHTHTHTAPTQTGSSHSRSRSSSSRSSALRASSHPRAARCLVYLGGLEQLAAHLQSRLQLGLQLEHAP